MSAAKGSGQLRAEPNQPSNESLPNTLGGIGLPADLGRTGRPRATPLGVLIAVAAFAVAVLVWHPV